MGTGRSVREGSRPASDSASPHSITVDTYPNQPFTGKVTYVSDFLDPRTRTARVRCEVPNGDIRLKLDMFANVNLPTTFSRKTLAVPTGAIQEVGDKTVVFIRKTATEFEPRWVSAGNTVRDLVEITNGLTRGRTRREGRRVPPQIHSGRQGSRGGIECTPSLNGLSDIAPSS